jgi:hypothetical protein
VANGINLCLLFLLLDICLFRFHSLSFSNNYLVSYLHLIIHINLFLISIPYHKNNIHHLKLFILLISTTFLIYPPTLDFLLHPCPNFRSSGSFSSASYYSSHCHFYPFIFMLHPLPTLHIIHFFLSSILTLRSTQIILGITAHFPLIFAPYKWVSVCFFFCKKKHICFIFFT